MEELIHCFLPRVGLLIGLDSHVQFFVPRGRYYTVVAVFVETDNDRSGKFWKGGVGVFWQQESRSPVL